MPAAFRCMPGRPLILVNETDINTRDLITAVLQAEGYRVVVGQDGDDALQLAQSLLPDLIIMNFMMSKKQAPAVCTRLRADPRTHSIKVLLMSTPRTVEEFAMQVDASLAKPFDIQDLIQLVGELAGPPVKA